jgi:hypothetical protein
MPLINGSCVPPVCFRRTFVARWASLQHNQIVGGVSTITPIGENEWPNPEMLKKGLVMLGDQNNLDCDGCICFTLRRWAPPLQTKIPPFTVEENSETDKNGVLTVNKYEVVGGIYLLHSVGWCMAPGTEVKIGEKWMPVEEAVKLKAGGSSSEEEKPEKKKKHPSKPKGKGGKRVAKKKGRG